MEYIDGCDLRQLLRRRPAGLPPAAAAYIVHELALALDYIHTREQPVIHRDVTPHNVFCTLQGEVKLGDFGVAKATARLTHTQAGQIKGKLPYLAPEQASGDPVTLAHRRLRGRPGPLRASDRPAAQPGKQRRRAAAGGAAARAGAALDASAPAPPPSTS